MWREIIGRLAGYIFGKTPAERAAARRRVLRREAPPRDVPGVDAVGRADFSREQREAHRPDRAKGFRGTHGGPPADAGTHKDWDARPHK
jgi:hypothetical protein